MLRPAAVVERTRECIEADDPAVGRETAEWLIASVIGGDCRLAVLVDAVDAVVAAYPSVATTVVTELDAWVVDAFERPNRQLHPDAISVVLAVVERVPSTAADATGTLSLAARFHELDLDELLLEMAAEDPGALASIAPDLVDGCLELGRLRPAPGGALARAAATVPGRFDALADALEAELAAASEPAARQSALERVGAVAAVAPDVVVGLSATIASLARDGTPETRVGALRALGRLVGGDVEHGSRFGVPVSGPAASASSTLRAGLDDPVPSVRAGAATALVDAAAFDAERATGVVTEFGARIADETTVVRDAMLQGLDALARARDDDDRRIPRAVLDAIEAAGDDSANRDVGRASSRLLGNWEPTPATRGRAEALFVEALRATGTDRWHGAVDAAPRALSGWASDSSPVVHALSTVATDDAEFRARETLRALAEAPDADRVVETVEALLEPSPSDGSLPSGASLGALVASTRSPRLVDQLLDRAFAVVTADPPIADDHPTADVSGAECSDADGSDADGAAVSLESEPATVAAAIAGVAADWPDGLVPHADALVDLLVDDAAAGATELASAVALVADHEPGAVASHADALRARLTGDCDRAVAGHVLDALLAVDAAADDLLETVRSSYATDALAPAFGRLGDRAPLLVLDGLTRLQLALEAEDAHHAVSWWLDLLPDFATGSVTVHAPALDLAASALTADGDDWVRWDAAEALARVADRHPDRVATSRSTLHDAVGDENANVTRWTLRALQHLGGLADTSDLAAFAAHPDPDTRDVAADLLDTTDQDTAVRSPHDQASADAREPGTVASDRWRYLYTGTPPLQDAPISAAGPTARRRELAVFLAGWTHPDAAVRDRAGRALLAHTSSTGAKKEADEGADDAGDGGRERVAAGRDPTAPRAAAADVVSRRLLDDPDPVVRALAAHALDRRGPDVPLTPRTLVGRLADAAGDAEPVVQRYAARAMETLAPAFPDTVAARVDALATALSDADDATAGYCNRALRALAAERPAAVTPAVDGLAASLVDAGGPTPLAAARALERTPSDALVDADGLPENAVARLDTNAPGIERAAATVVGLLASEDPTLVRPFLDDIVDDTRHEGVRAAFAAVAADDPDGLPVDEDAVRDWRNDRYTRETLAAMRSPWYRPRLEEHLREHPARLLEHPEPYIEYLTAPCSPDERRERLGPVEYAIERDDDLLEPLVALVLDSTTDADPHERLGYLRGFRSLVTAIEPRDNPEVVADVVEATALGLVAADRWAHRSEAVDALAAFVDTVPRVLGVLGVDVVHVGLARLEDDHDGTRRHAASLLARVATVRDDPDIVYDRLPRIESGATAAATRGAVRALGAVAPVAGASRDALARLTAALDADDRWVRRDAIDAIHGVVDAITHRFRPTTVELERALETAREHVRERLDDPAAPVRAAACRCLGELGTPEDVDRLTALVDAPYTEVSDAATAALDALTDDASTDDALTDDA